MWKQLNEGVFLVAQRSADRDERQHIEADHAPRRSDAQLGRAAIDHIPGFVTFQGLRCMLDVRASFAFGI